MEERIRIALNLAMDLGKKFQGLSEISKEDLPILEKYAELGLIKFAKGKKNELGKRLYFPTVESKEFEGLSAKAWLDILRTVIDHLDIDSGFSIHSANEYLGQNYKYGITPTVIQKSYASKVQLDEEARVIELLRKELKDEK